MKKMYSPVFTETCFDKRKDCADLDPLTRFCSDFKDQCKKTCNSCGKYVTLLIFFLSAQSHCHYISGDSAGICGNKK